MILRYQAEKGLEPYPDDDLRSYVLSYDEHFTHAGIPTDRLKDVYLEAMRTHGAYLLKVDDYLRAWDRLKIDSASLDARKHLPDRPNCKTCMGTGMVKRAVPKPGVPMWVDCEEAVAECVFCRPVSTGLARTG